MAAAVAAERDPAALRAARILVSLRSRKLAAWPEWVPKPPPAGEPSYSDAEAEPATAPAEVPMRWAARRPRSRGRRASCSPWRKALRELLDLAESVGGEEERYTAPAPAPRRTVEAAALCYGAAAGSGSPSTSSADRAARSRSRSQPRHADEKAAAQSQTQAKPLAAAPAAKEPMKAPSPDTPLDYGAGGSGASSSADDAARPRGKRRSPGARGSGGGYSCDDDDGCSSPAKRARAAAAGNEKPIPAEQTMQSETLASSAKGFVLDLNLPPPLDDDDAC